MLGRVFLGVLTAAGVLIGCGEPTAKTSSGPEGAQAEIYTSRKPLSDLFFKDPMGESGLSAESASTAEERLPFYLNTPDSLPDPEKIVSTDPRSVSAIDAAAAWVFDSHEFGGFVLTERISVGGDAAWGRLVDDATEAPGCETRDFTTEEQLELGPAPGGQVTTCKTEGADRVSIRGGEEALLADGPFETNLIWHEPLRAKGRAFSNFDHELALEIRLVGPTDRFSPQQALKVAERI